MVRLAASGITTLNTLQLAAVEPALRGLDVIVHAETGSGKTLCYALPLVAALDDASTNLQAIVVAPTLALSSQIAKVLNTLRPDCAAALRASGVDEVHGSCREPVRSAMRHRPPQPVPMGGERRNTADSEFEWKQASERRVRAAFDAARDVARRADEIDVLGALRKAGA